MKKLYLLISFFFLEITLENKIFCNQEITEAHTNEMEKFSDGKLSDKNELFIRQIMACLNIKSDIEIRQPSAEALQLAPASGFVFYEPIFKYLFVNEKWFNKLTEKEQFFIIGNTLIGLAHEKPNSKLTENLIKWASAGFEVALGALLYNHLGSYNTLFGYEPSWKMKLLMCFALAIPYELIGAFAQKKISAKKRQEIILNYNKTLIRTFDCRDAAISVLAKLKREIDILNEEDKSYWQNLYEFWNLCIQNAQETT